MRRAVVAIVLSMCAGAALGGNGLFGSLPGEMRASATQVAVGGWVTVSLEVTTEQTLDALALVFDAPDCARLQGVPRRDHISLQAGLKRKFTIKAQILRMGACRIGATVLRSDDTDSRTGWVYAVVVNPLPDAQHEHGHDARGRPTVEATVK